MDKTLYERVLKRCRAEQTRKRCMRGERGRNARKRDEGKTVFTTMTSFSFAPKTALGKYDIKERSKHTRIIRRKWI